MVYVGVTPFRNFVRLRVGYLREFNTLVPEAVDINDFRKSDCLNSRLLETAAASSFF